MSFIVNLKECIQKDFSPYSAIFVSKMKVFDPDLLWTKVGIAD